MSKVMDYSIWDQIKLSDDEDDSHPNIDTPSLFRGRHQSTDNVKPEASEETEEKEQKKYEKQIMHFGMLQHLDDSQQYLFDNPQLVCKETSDHLTVMCIDLQVKEKPALMERVAHQTVLMLAIVEVAKTVKVDPRCFFHKFFAILKAPNKKYQDVFHNELESFKDKVRGWTKKRMENAMKEYEEQEKQKCMGPGGLDPIEVYESFSPEIQKCFDNEDIHMLKDVMSKMDPTEAKAYLKRCIDSGLCVRIPRRMSVKKCSCSRFTEEVNQEQGESKKELHVPVFYVTYVSYCIKM